MEIKRKHNQSEITNCFYLSLYSYSPPKKKTRLEHKKRITSPYSRRKPSRNCSISQLNQYEPLSFAGIKLNANIFHSYTVSIDSVHRQNLISPRINVPPYRITRIPLFRNNSHKIICISLRKCSAGASSPPDGFI